MALIPLSKASSSEQIVNAVNAILQGRSNAVSSVTLRANETTTTITDPRISSDSAVVLVPTTANAAGAEVYQSATSNGSATFTHSSDSATDRTFKYVVCG